MRQKMREVFDELWIIDLEGGQSRPQERRRTFSPYVPPLPSPSACGTGPPRAWRYRRGVWKTRLTGSEHEKLAALDAIKSLGDLDWRECSQEWSCAVLPRGDRHIPRVASGYGRVPMAALRVPTQEDMAHR